MPVTLSASARQDNLQIANNRGGKQATSHGQPSPQAPTFTGKAR